MGSAWSARSVQLASPPITTSIYIGSTIGITGTAAATSISTLTCRSAGHDDQSLTVANPFTFVGQFGVIGAGNGLDFMRASSTPLLGSLSSPDPQAWPLVIQTLCDP